MLEHGGNLNEAVAHYGIARDDWLDLSTGINPWPYPVAPLPAAIWQRLPEACDELLDAACDYYGAPQLLPVAGTQAAIQALPQLRLRQYGPARVVVAAPSYAEHAHRWSQAGHALHEVPYALLEEAVDQADVLVLCNPNNPTGAVLAPATLHLWAQRLAARGGWLVVDEAFGDMTPHSSVAALTGHTPGLIVLRSIGKFFGLAGARLGFVAAEAGLLAALQDWLGPWSISGPAQHIGSAALRDRVWQAATRQRLLTQGARLHSLLAGVGIAASGSALYQWWPAPQALALHDWMACRGIWVRLFTRGAVGIRLGLPVDESGWTRLQLALLAWQKHLKESPP